MVERELTKEPTKHEARNTPIPGNEELPDTEPHAIPPEGGDDLQGRAGNPHPGKSAKPRQNKGNE